MPWVAVDDRFADHPKMLEAGPLAWALWLAGLAYCNSQRTDGFIPHRQVPRLVNFEGFSENGESAEAEGLAKSLVDVGLWERRKGKRGYWIHDYLAYQKSRAEIEGDIEKKRRAGRKGAEKRWAQRPPADSNGYGTTSGSELAGPMADGKAGAI